MSSDQQQQHRGEQNHGQEHEAESEQSSDVQEPTEPIERPGEPTPETEEQPAEPNGQSSITDGYFQGDPRRRQDTESGDGKLDPFDIPASIDLTTFLMTKEELKEAMKRPWDEAKEYIDDYTHESNSKSAVFEGEISYSKLNVLTDHIRGVVTESRLAVTEDGWYISVVDSANVAMLQIWLPESSWDSYNCERVGTTGLSWSMFEDALSHADTDSKIEVSVEDALDDDDETSSSISDFIINDGIPFEFSGISAQSCRNPPELPDLDLTNRFVLPGVDMREVLDRMDDITDHLEVNGKPDTNSVELHGEGDTSAITKEYSEFSDLTVYNGSRKNPVFDTEIEEEEGSVFSIEYLHDYFKSPKRGDQKIGYEFQFGDESPIKATRDFGADGFIEFMVAPRIQSN